MSVRIVGTLIALTIIGAGIWYGGPMLIDRITPDWSFSAPCEKWHCNLFDLIGKDNQTDTADTTKVSDGGSPSDSSKLTATEDKEAADKKLNLWFWQRASAEPAPAETVAAATDSAHESKEVAEGNSSTATVSASEEAGTGNSGFLARLKFWD
jgi:hypothetical protein